MKREKDKEKETTRYLTFWKKTELKNSQRRRNVATRKKNSQTTTGDTYLCSTKAAEAKPCYNKKERKMTFRVQTNSSSDGINEMVLSFDEGSCYTRKIMVNCFFFLLLAVFYIFRHVLQCLCLCLQKQLLGMNYGQSI